MTQHQWFCLTTVPDYYAALMLQQRLQAHGINAVLVNKLDRSQLAYGFVEIHVPLEQAAQALDLLEPA
ncbi:MAG: DUF2007 domain-containing protein [Chitinophagales bacterium]|nr:DUF2007 domain-containing protein [Chitinophagales bacterium]MDW8427170.1 DUF2007 domain-containing protein [Chitinophagales bacterium]